MSVLDRTVQTAKQEHKLAPLITSLTLHIDNIFNIVENTCGTEFVEQVLPSAKKSVR